jgi:hypothetical protein
MTANKLPEEMVELAVIGTDLRFDGMHQPKLTVLTTGREIKVEMITLSRVRAVAAAKRSAEKSGFIVAEVICPKCHKSGRAEYARGQRDALLAVDDQIGRVKRQAADFLRYMQDQNPEGDVATEGRLRGLAEALREAKALLARVGRGE